MSAATVRSEEYSREEIQRILRLSRRQLEAFEKQGLALPLANVILNLGLARPDQVAKVLAHQGTASLRCPQCRRPFTVPDFQANRRYKCETCMVYLEIVVDDSLKADPSPVPRPAAPARQEDPLAAVLPFHPPGPRVDPPLRLSTRRSCSLKRSRHCATWRREYTGSRSLRSPMLVSRRPMGFGKL